jgi:hypothetical protein
VLRSCGGIHRRSTHDLYVAKIWYRHHPLYGVEVTVVRYLRRNSADRVVIVRCPDRAQIALPEWMLNSVACDRLADELRPRVAISALVALKRLLEESLPAMNQQSRAKSSTGGVHARQGRHLSTAVAAPALRRPDLECVAGEHSQGVPGSFRGVAEGNIKERRPEGE